MSLSIEDNNKSRSSIVYGSTSTLFILVCLMTQPSVGDDVIALSESAPFKIADRTERAFFLVFRLTVCPFNAFLSSLCSKEDTVL